MKGDKELLNEIINFDNSIKNKNYNLLNINNKWVLIDGNKSVVFIVPNNTFKSKNEEEIFINLIEKQI